MYPQPRSDWGDTTMTATTRTEGFDLTRFLWGHLEPEHETTTITTNTDADCLGAGWLASLAGRLVAGMREEGIADPLSEPLTLAATLYDLFTLAGAAVPSAIRERVEG